MWNLEVGDGLIGNNTLMLPLADSSGGMPVVVVGPSDRRNPLRWFVKLPSREDAERIPSRLGMDRRTIRFTPVLLYLDQWPPPNVTASFSQLICGKERCPIDRRGVHLWHPLPDTVSFPGISLEGTQMEPGEVLEINGWGHWWTKRARSRTPNWTGSQPTERPAPSSQETYLLSMNVVFKTSWLPSSSRSRKLVIGAVPMVDDLTDEVSEPTTP